MNKENENSIKIWDDVSDVFQRCQYSTTAYSSGILSLKRSYTINPTKFLESFQQCIHHILTIFKREPNVERLIKFIGIYCSDETNSDLSIILLKHLINFMNAKDKAPRMRTCQIISVLLADLQDSLIDQDTWDKLEENLLSRANDKVPAVRVQAVMALERLQDPSNPNDPIMETYIRLLNGDSSKEVRKAVLRCIGLNKISLTHIIARTRDTKEDVRACAFQQLSSRIHLQYLSISQRSDLLEQGLQDRGSIGIAKRSCEDMLSLGWLEMKGGDPIALLETLDVQSSEKIALLTIRALVLKCKQLGNDAPQELKDAVQMNFDSLVQNPSTTHCEINENESVDDDDQDDNSIMQFNDEESFVDHTPKNNRRKAKRKLEKTPASEKKVSIQNQDEKFSIPLLTPERAMYWKVLYEQAKLDSKEELLDKLVPNLSTFANVLEISFEHYQLIHHEMLKSLEISENADETLVESFDSATFVLKTLLQFALSLDFQYDAVGRNRISETIKQILKQENTEDSLVRPSIDVLRSLESDENSFIENVVHLINSVDSIMFRLVLSRSLLETTKKLPSKCPELRGLLEVTILPSVQHPDSIVRLEAIHCIGLYGLLEASAAAKLLPILRTSMEADEEGNEIRLISMQSIFDFFMIFDKQELSKFDENDNNDEDGDILIGQVFSSVLVFLENPSSELRLSAVEGLAKIEFIGRLRDTRILQCLMALYFHPSSENDTKVRQCLSVFFPEFALKGSENQSLILTMAIPMLRTLILPSKGSALDQVPFNLVAEYIVYLLCESEKQISSSNDSICFHELLGIELAIDLLLCRNKVHIKSLSKIMNMLQLEKATQSGLAKLLELSNQCLKSSHIIDDRLSRNQIEKFAKSLPQSLKPTETEMKFLQEKINARHNALKMIIGNESDSDELIPEKVTGNRRSKRNVIVPVEKPVEVEEKEVENLIIPKKDDDSDNEIPKSKNRRRMTLMSEHQRQLDAILDENETDDDDIE